MRLRTLLAACLCGLATSAGAFDGHRAAQGPLSLLIEEIPTVTAYDQPVKVRTVLRNASPAELTVRVAVRDLVDRWTLAGPAEQELRVPPQGEAAAEFQLVAGRPTWSAHYPVHVYATLRENGVEAEPLHAVRIFQTDFSQLQSADANQDLPVLAVPQRGAVALATADACRVAWNYDNQPLRRLPVGWQGSEPESKASFRRGIIDRGGFRQAIQLHPPYQPRGGAIAAEFRVQLPDTTPLSLSFFNAIRTQSEAEPASDGVTFRVWADEAKLFELHTDAKTWVPGQVDLSPLAGREVLLRLESHPGPRGNTVCDQSYWGDAVIAAGTPPRVSTEAEWASRRQRAVQALQGQQAEAGVFTWDLQNGGRAAVVPGFHGLADAAIAFGCGERAAVFDGLEIEVLDQGIGRWPSAAWTEAVEWAHAAGGSLRMTHRLRIDDNPVVLQAELSVAGGGLRAAVTCSERVTDMGLAAADRQAARVYFGHGYCVERPAAFRVAGGGHSLSASHVGLDLEGGLSLLVACDTPPDHLQVDPARRFYSLRTHPEATWTFVPGQDGAMDCAVRYRPLNEKQPSAGVARKAGRFCFDIWGGRYAEGHALVQRCFDYGLTDALVVMHVWQRWGYDYRLPDIFPPDPKLGTTEELRDFARACAQRDVPFALHDNYIDYYPDAKEFSYGHIVFTEDGRPQKAWINEGRDAQSYRWRPDRIQPFVERNLTLIQPALEPSAYFIDVFTSIQSFDFYDEQGDFHAKGETQRAWGESFAWIRERMGGQAPMISEAGGDHLIGYVDGADCQFLQLSAKPERFYLTVGCEDWERVPWFDAVHHTRFSLHGVGYSGRYQGTRERNESGITSDDYLSAELLTGHALMVDRPCLVREAVRKYWLAQPIARRLAADEIQRVEFAGDMHRQVVHWQSGARVFVNRSDKDWNVKGRLLPPFGYLAVCGDAISCVERIEGRVVERSQAGTVHYLNARGKSARAVAPSRAGGARRAEAAAAAAAESPAADFGLAVTPGAVRIEGQGDQIVVTPLPDSLPFDLTLRPARVLGRPAQASAVEAIDAQGAKQSDVVFAPSGEGVTFRLDGGTFAYRVRVR